MRVSEIIRTKLEESLAPALLEIIDESHRHESHSGSKPSGETHFNVTIVSTVFEGKTRVARHRMVFDLLKEQMDAPIHALALTTLTPKEHVSR